MLPWDKSSFKDHLDSLILNGNLDNNMADEILYFIKILDLEGNSIQYPMKVFSFTDGVQLIWSTVLDIHSFDAQIFCDGSLKVFFINTSNLNWAARTNINDFGIHNRGLTYDKTIYYLSQMFLQR
jgi:hypothetical protein